MRMNQQWKLKTPMCGCPIDRECVYNPLSTWPQPAIYPLSAHGLLFNLWMSSRSSARLHRVLFVKKKKKKTSSCTTAGFSHSTTTTELNYKAALGFPWSSNHVWLGHLELTLLWFRSASMNDSSDTQTPATAANMLRIHRSQATQLGRGDKSREEDNSDVSLLHNLTLGSYFVSN